MKKSKFKINDLVLPNENCPMYFIEDILDKCYNDNVEIEEIKISEYWNDNALKRTLYSVAVLFDDGEYMSIEALRSNWLDFYEKTDDNISTILSDMIGYQPEDYEDEDENEKGYVEGYAGEDYSIFTEMSLRLKENLNTINQIREEVEDANISLDELDQDDFKLLLIKKIVESTELGYGNTDERLKKIKRIIKEDDILENFQKYL